MTTEATTTPAATTLAEKRKKKREDLTLKILSEGQTRILEALVTHRYLTTPQLVFVGVSPNKTYILNELLPRLLKNPCYPLVSVRAFAPAAGTGSRPHIYCLTKYGAEIAADVLFVPFSEIRYPADGIQFQRDFDHRVAYIDVCIAFDKWLTSGDSRALLERRNYFDKTGASRVGADLREMTRLEHPSGRSFAPDGLMLFEAAGKRHAVAVEVHRFPDTGRIVEQLTHHMEAVKSGAATRLLKHDKTNRILSIATVPEEDERVRKRMLTVPDFLPHFLGLYAFANLDTLKSDFANAWKHADGTPVDWFK